VTPFAQAGGNISGVVSDRSDSAIPGTVVILKGSATQGVRVAKANSEGFCTAATLAPDEYDVAGSAAGFQTQAVNLTMVIGSHTGAELHAADPARS